MCFMVLRDLFKSCLLTRSVASSYDQYGKVHHPKNTLSSVSEFHECPTFCRCQTFAWVKLNQTSVRGCPGIVQCLRVTLQVIIIVM